MVMTMLLLLLVLLAHVFGTNALPTRSDFLVENLDHVVPEFGLFEGKMHSGRLPVENGSRSGKMMFWLFAPDNPVSTDSIQLWLNGGPGCTSFSAGLLFEHSPVTIPPRPAGYCCIQENEPLQYNKFAWTNATTMLYIEQPFGVGFSEGGPPPENEDDVSGDVYSFLVNFFKVFSEYQDYRFFVFGESYAGMYAPSILRKVYLETKRFQSGHTTDRANITVGGLGLGNGWVDARVQGPAAIDYAYWHGLIDSFTKDSLWARWKHCIAGKGKEPLPFHEFNVPDDCAISTGTLMAAGKGIGGFGPNQYDVTTWDPYSTILEGNTTIQNFFNDPKVKRALHAPQHIQWLGCIPGAGRRRRLMASLLENDKPVSTLPYIAELLDGGVPVLIYNGDRDLSCCAQGSEMLLDSLERPKWSTAPRGLWKVGDEVAGYTKESNGLFFVVVYNSGHLVPFNQPRAALDLVTRFTVGQSFLDQELPSFHFKGQEKYLDQGEAHDKSSSRSWHIVPFVLTACLAFAGGYFVSARKRKPGYDRI